MTSYFQRNTSAAPLAVFRVILGSMLFVSIVRFWLNGWIESVYVRPKYHFSFYCFEFIKPLGGYTYLIFAICGLAALLVMLGLYYKAAIVTLFLSFTYIELIDKSTYLNHYYFISMICMMMIFLPANVYFSLDARRNHNIKCDAVPSWTVDVIRGFVAIVYVYAGLAKINSDWLLHAQPLRIWLPSRNDMFLIGPLFNKVWVAFAFSWMGCLYDLSIPLLLSFRVSRLPAFCAVVIFHLLTAWLFPIGMFPYIMIGTSLIFFPASFHERLISSIRGWFSRIGLNTFQSIPGRAFQVSKFKNLGAATFFSLFFIVQIILPWRYLVYPDELFWTEEGYRFSWRVMLMEKAGHAEFTVRDVNGYFENVNNNDFLTPLQEKMMAAQPDMLLQYAHILEDHYKKKGFVSPQVYVDSYVTLNGRLGRPMISPTTDLAKLRDNLQHKYWILPFNDEIKGL
ncbi:HTTM domain-containing protein [Chryseolinea sp. T2]|uniref:HTTM domain-containing protein n=1 Tax=Chryseolinea sp. T2 TaxID=3129255 RepID=UPI0030771DD9